ncbi:MAG: M23 family metallopeptidase [Deltaproteobacteria bacterium]|nr:MAG: M23 family metallopeptidase [Deltaproteobacteria bacterium]
MRALVPFLPLFLLYALSVQGGEGPPVAAPVRPFPVTLSTFEPAQGEPVLVEVSPLPRADSVVMIWKGKEVPMKKDGPGRFLGLFGVDLLEKPGKAVLSFRAAGDGEAFRFDAEIVIREKDFPVQEITLPKEMTQFDKETLGRINREARRLAKRFSRVSSPPVWSFPFLPPVADFRPKGFGSRRVINGEPRSPHAGVDVSLPAGTPVVAIAGGVVAFAGEQFFGGNSVVLDHGGSVFSIYYHLREYAVSEGQNVIRGERIGAVGASGRATGPHLHFSVRAAGGRIDPSLLFSLPSR